MNDKTTFGSNNPHSSNLFNAVVIPMEQVQSDITCLQLHSKTYDYFLRSLIFEIKII